MKLKKIFLLAAVALTGIATSCQYDDGEIWENVNNLADRVTSLEAVTKQMNSDIAAMQSIVSAVEKKVLVSEVEKVADGCIIHFTDGTQAVIKNGKNGQNGTNGTNGKDGQDGTDGKDGQNGSDGKDGVNGQDGKDGKDGKDAPVINVAKDNGVYYWTITIDGKTEWLTDEEGNKFPVSAQNGANGADGVAPVVTIGDNGNWFINGVDTDKKAVGDKGADGDSAFKTVEEQNGMLVITMNDTDKTVYTLPMAPNAEEKFVIYKDKDLKEISADNVCLESTETVLNYETLLQNASVEVISVPDGLSILVDEENKQLEIEGTLSGNNNKAVLLFYNGNQTITSVLTFDTSALASVNKELMLAQANNQNEYTIILSIPAGENNVIKLPAAGNRTTRTFKIGSVDTSSELVIKDLSGSGEYQGEVIVELEDGADIDKIDVQLPGATVKFIGKAGEVIASTKPNTFIVGEGSITTLTIVKGNVEIEEGATVGSIVRHADNKDEATYVINKGALTTAPTDKILVYGSVAEMNLHLGIDQGGIVTLTEDVVLTKPLVIAKDMTVILDLNGKTISQVKECTASYSMITNKGNLTIKGNGTISFKDLSNGGGDEWGSYVITNNGTLVVENGTLKHFGSADGDHDTNLPIQNYKGKVIINGGTISSVDFRSLRDFTAGGEIIINGGKFEGQVWMQGLGNGSSSLTINGGEFEPVSGYDGSSVYITNGTNSVYVSITGGKFNTKIGAKDPTKEGVKGSIIGGNFTESAKVNTSSDLLAEGYTFVQGENENSWTVVESVTDPEGGQEGDFETNPDDKEGDGQGNTQNLETGSGEEESEIETEG